MGNVDSIRYGGVIFRRYPDSKNWTERSYYVPGVADRKKGARRLHEEIWRAAHGSIPDGFDIHHVDFNPLNNDVANLRCVAADEHQRIHVEHRRETGAYVGVEQLAHLERIRPLTKAWHASDEGREWHRRNAVAAWEGREHREERCQQCGAAYQTRDAGPVKFCSNACKSQARRLSGVDDVDKTCVNCGETFRANRYARPVSCSRVCAQRYRSRQARAGVQPEGGGGA